MNFNRLFYSVILCSFVAVSDLAQKMMWDDDERAIIETKNRKNEKELSSHPFRSSSWYTLHSALLPNICEMIADGHRSTTTNCTGKTAECCEQGTIKMDNSDVVFH